MDISTCLTQDYLYAVGAENNKQGLLFSKNKKSWNKVNKYVTIRIIIKKFCDPLDQNKVFFMDTWLHHTVDGGKTVVKTGEKSKHVDIVYMDGPNDTGLWVVGCDRGLYETWDHASNWHYKPNLPIILNFIKWL